MKGSEEHSRVGGDREINPAKRNLRGSRERGGGGGGGPGRVGPGHYRVKSRRDVLPTLYTYT